MSTDSYRKMGAQDASQGKGMQNTNGWSSQAREAYQAAYNKTRK